MCCHFFCLQANVMKHYTIIFSFLVLYSSCYVNSEIVNLSSLVIKVNPLIQLFRDLKFQIFGRNSENPFNLQIARNIDILQSPVSLTVPFPCNVTGYRSLKPPSSVHQLRPGDIDVIGALGDSLTAGAGLVATNSLQIFLENRGLSWSIGGQGTWREYVTLPNILKEFNPNLIGYSLRDSLANHRESQFNPAESGAFSKQLPYMTNVLIKRIISDPRVDLKNHWKLITILIGANDLCKDMCYENENDFLMKNKIYLIKSLRLLRDNLPRTIVNLVPAPDVSILNRFAGKPIRCEKLNIIECPCVVLNKQKENLIQNISRKWQNMDEEVSQLDEFNLNDFAVVYQPFLKEIKIPLDSNNKTDYSFLSQDCFHISQKFNARAANLIWNNMLQKIGEKTEKLDGKLFDDFLCPTEQSPYIITKQNNNKK